MPQRVRQRLLRQPVDRRVDLEPKSGQINPARPASHGFGLLGMTERVQLLGGTLRAGPAPGGGWAVDAELPTEIPR